MMSRAKRVVAWSLIALATMVAFAEASHRVVREELLKTLDLSSYPAGMMPPDFLGRTSDGERVSLANLTGRVVLLNFWASWCPDCRPEMPLFEQLHRELGSQGLTVLGVNFREGPATIQRYAKELGLTFPLVLDPKGETYASYGVIALPTTFLIGRDGHPVALAVGHRDWRSAPARAIIKVLLAESGLRQGTR